MTVDTITTIYKEPLAYISQTLQSLTRQTYAQLNIFLLLDDPQRQDVWKYLLEQKKADKRIHLIKNDTNQGLTKSLNIAISKGSSPLIARLDAGDSAHPSRFKKQVEYFHKNPDTTLVATAYTYINQHNQPLHSPKQITDAKKISETLPHKNILIHSSIMFRRFSNKPYREKCIYAQDYDLYLRLLSDHQQIACLSERLTYFRLDTQSISYQHKFHQYQFANLAQKWYYQRIRIGSDDYQDFAPQDILSQTPQMTPALLRKTIITLIDAGQDVEARRQYRRHYQILISPKLLVTLFILTCAVVFPGMVRRMR